MKKVSFAFVASMTLVGCVMEQATDRDVSTASDPEAESASTEPSVEGSEEALYGAFSTSSCNTAQKVRLREAMIAGRTIARSSAFADCLDRVMRTGYYGFGPYKACFNLTAVDPFHDSSITTQVSKVLSTSRSANALHVECYVPEPGDPAGYTSHGGLAPAGYPEAIHVGVHPELPSTAVSGDDYARLAGVIWHEVMHEWGWWHNEGWDDHFPCNQDNWFDSVPYIVGQCMTFVENASESECGDRTCDGPRMTVVSEFPVDSDTGCVCVRDSLDYAPVLNEGNQDGRYGSSLAAGDFDGDSFVDLAVGAPYEGSDFHGGVYVYRGSAFGLRPWLYFAGTADARLGTSLAAGDLNGDGRADLAIGAPGDSTHVGYVHLYKGDVSKGLVFVRKLGQAGLAADENGDLFGQAVAIGPVFGSGLPGLVVGAPGEKVIDNTIRSGMAFVFEGITTADLVQPSYGLRQDAIDAPANGDNFGKSIAVGDLQLLDGHVIVVGAPGDKGVGRAYVFRATSRTATSSNPDYALVPTNAQSGMEFGASLAIAGVGVNDGQRIAVGAPKANSGTGAVYLHMGTELVPRPDLTFERRYGAVKQVLAGSTASGNFGAAVARVKLGSRDQLAVGVPWVSGGQVKLYKSTSTGAVLEATKTQTGAEEVGDRFGTSIVAEDFDHDGDRDLVAGQPGEKPGDQVSTGAVTHLKGDGLGVFAGFRTYYPKQ